MVLCIFSKIYIKKSQRKCLVEFGLYTFMHEVRQNKYLYFKFLKVNFKTN